MSMRAGLYPFFQRKLPPPLLAAVLGVSPFLAARLPARRAPPVDFQPAPRAAWTSGRSAMMARMELKAVRLEIPEDGNIIVGQSHFIKTVEDLYEALAGSVPQMKFGLAFSEASGACLVRADGNDEELKQAAIRNALAVGAGHTFYISLREGYPINLLTRIRDVPEVCGIFCATANQVEVIVAETAQGRGILGVVDGAGPKGVEGPADVEWRHSLLRKIGYKR
jgi:hypothetical protein